MQNTSTVNFSKNGYECGECGLVAETRPGLKKHIAVFHPTPNPDLRLNNAFLRKMSTSSKCPMSSCRLVSNIFFLANIFVFLTNILIFKRSLFSFLDLDLQKGMKWKHIWLATLRGGTN